jgi:hypothetical protein
MSQIAYRSWGIYTKTWLNAESAKIAEKQQIFPSFLGVLGDPGVKFFGFPFELRPRSSCI